MEKHIELTVIMPCLNEAETIAKCIGRAQKCLSENGIVGEVLIADNGSTDGSIDIANSCGARVVSIHERGYGAALIGGTQAAYGKYCIMGDADDSYDFSNLMPYLEKLREGYDLVMGNRFQGGIEKGAMPFSHRYLGTPVISFIGRLFYHNNIGDFNCGMRGYNTEKIKSLHLNTTGMEYASEMIVKASLNNLSITEVPTTLSKDGRSRPPYLNTWSDGWRHLKFLLLHSPNWLFLYPGILLLIVGIIGEVLITSMGMFSIGGVYFGVHTLLYCMLFVVLGITIIYFYIFTGLYAEQSHFIPEKTFTNLLARFSTEKGVLAGILLTLIGILVSVVAVILWKNLGFGELIPESMMRIVIPAITLIEVGMETFFASFFIGILKIKRMDHNKENACQHKNEY